MKDFSVAFVLNADSFLSTSFRFSLIFLFVRSPGGGDGGLLLALHCAASCCENAVGTADEFVNANDSALLKFSNDLWPGCESG